MIEEGSENETDQYTFEGENYVPGGLDTSEDTGAIVSMLPKTTLSSEFMASLSTALSMALSLSFLNTKSFPKSSFSLLVLLATCAGVYYEKSHSTQLPRAQSELELDHHAQQPQHRDGLWWRRVFLELKGFLGIFVKWWGPIIFHSVILLLHVVLSTHSLNECGVVRTLIVAECGPVATAVLVYCFNNWVRSAVLTVSATAGHTSSYAQNFDMNSLPTSSPLELRRSGSAGTKGINAGMPSKNTELFTVVSSGLVAVGLMLLVFSDTRSVSGNIALLMFGVISYIRAYFLPNIPPQAYLFPTVISGLILAPWGVPGLFSRKFILLLDIKLLVVLFASFFSVNNNNNNNASVAFHIYFVCQPLFFLNGFNKRFADYRATYMFKRQKNRTGITYCAITHVVIIAGLVFERLFTNLHYATMFTFFSSALVILGVSIALDRLPASATRPRASDEDRNDVIEFIKTRADMLLAYYSRANQKNYKESIESAVRSTSKFFHQTVETPKTRQLLVYVLLSLTFMGVEVTYGISKGNLSLISAGAHMFFDSFGLIVGLFASYVAKQAPNRSYSYGYGRIKVLSFFVNGVMLLIVSVTVLVESLLHVLSGATEAHSPMFLLISLVGLLIHLIGVIFFHEHSNILKNALRHRDNETRPGNGGRHDTSNAQSNSSSEDMNLRGIFIHVMVDTVSSLGLVISTIFVQIYNYDICDPICSIIISVLTFKSVLPQMGKSLRILLQGSAFSEAETSAFQSRLTELASAETSGPSSGVAHYAAVCTSFCVWAQTPGYVVATATLCISQDANEQHILVAATRFLKSKGITSSCIECIKHPVDTPLASPCLPSVNPQELSISTNVENKK